MESDLYPTTTYRDPLIFPSYVKTNDHTSRWEQCNGDYLLDLYTYQLDREIADDIPAVVEHRQLFCDIYDNARIFGWCVVKFFEEEVRVFSPLQKEDWITELKDGKKERIGIKVKWTDDIGNTWEHACIFGEDCYLVIWQNGNGIALNNAPNDTVFARSDLSNSILSLAINLRQMRAQIAFSAAKPAFKWITYGESITTAQRTALKKQMMYIDGSNALGAPLSVVANVTVIEDKIIANVIPAINKFQEAFAGATRLPLSFYYGEKQTGGLGDTGQTEDEKMVQRKKQYILKHLYADVTVIFSEQYGITLPVIEDVYKEVDVDGQEDQRVNQDEQVD